MALCGLASLWFPAPLAHLPLLYGLVTSSVFSTQDAWDCYRSQGAYAGGKSDSASFETLPLSFTDNGDWHHLVLTTKGHGKGMDMYIDGKLEATHPRGLNCEQEAGGCIGLNKGNSDPSRYFNANGVGGEPIDPAGDMRLCGRQIGGAITNDLAHTGNEDFAQFDPRRYFHGQVAHFAVWDSPLSHHQVNALLGEYRLMYRLPKDLSPAEADKLQLIADKASLNTTVATQASYIKELQAELYAAERKEKCLAKCDANHAKCRNYCSSCHS